MMMLHLREGNPCCLKELGDNIESIYEHVLRQKALSCGEKYLQKVQSLYRNWRLAFL